MTPPGKPPEGSMVEVYLFVFKHGDTNRQKKRPAELRRSVEVGFGFVDVAFLFEVVEFVLNGRRLDALLG